MPNSTIKFELTRYLQGPNKEDPVEIQKKYQEELAKTADPSEKTVLDKAWLVFNDQNGQISYSDEEWETAQKVLLSLSDKAKRAAYRNQDIDFTNASSQTRREVLDTIGRYTLNKNKLLSNKLDNGDLFSVPEPLKRTYQKYENNNYQRHLSDISKKITKTIQARNKPYKSYLIPGLDVLRDLIEPLRGVLNLAKAIWHLLVILTITPITLLVVVPIFFLVVTPFQIDSARFVIVDTAKKMAQEFNKMAFSAVYGLWQLATTPFTWFFKIPRRSILTLREGATTIEQSAHIKEIAQETKDVLTDLSEATQAKVNIQTKAHLLIGLATLHAKFNHSTIKHRRTGIKNTDEKTYFAELNNDCQLGTLNPHSDCAITDKQKTHITNYLNLFLMGGSKNIDQENPVLSEETLLCRVS